MPNHAFTVTRSAPGVSPRYDTTVLLVNVLLIVELKVTDTAIFVNTVKQQDRNGIQAKHPLHGIGSPEDIIGASIFLASDEARWITGVCLPVDGGYTMQ